MKNSNNIGLGNRIRSLRKERQLTIVQLSSMTDISCGNLSEIERSFYIPSNDKLTRLAEALDCSVSWLLTGKKQLSHGQNQVIEIFNHLSDSEQEELFLLIKYRCCKH